MPPTPLTAIAQTPRKELESKFTFNPVMAKVRIYANLSSRKRLDVGFYSGITRTSRFDWNARAVAMLARCIDRGNVSNSYREVFRATWHRAKKLAARDVYLPGLSLRVNRLSRNAPASPFFGIRAAS